MNIKNRIIALCFILSIMFILFGCHLREDSTIYNPTFEKNETSGILEISKIEFTDTATVFYFDAYHCTNSDCWFSIAERTILQGSAQSYKIIGCEGIELGKRMTVPESGHVAFVLYFEPVDKSEGTVDFKEGDNAGDFRITGIKLYKESQPATAIKCTLKGEVIDRPQSSRLLLSKKGEDLRITQWISIPIRDGKFDYVLNCNHEELYELTFDDEWKQGGWRPITFISEQGVVNFTLHPMDKSEMNTIEGGKLNEEYLQFNLEEKNKFMPLYEPLGAKLDQLREESHYYTPEAQSLLDKAMASNDNELWAQWYKMQDNRLHITMAVKEIYETSDSIGREMYRLRLQYAKENPNIVGYSILVSETMSSVRQQENDILPIVDLYQTIYVPKYPNHPYTAKMVDYLTGSSLKAGVPFIDFSAVDFTGKSITLSECITGKPTVLHLWASWCGPCRRHGMELIPVYEEFHDKGFVVLGVARERDSFAAAETAIKQDKYPWKNLVELNDAEKIWVKYGLGNAGGGHFLIDEKGIIVAVSPSIDEIRDFLTKYYASK